MGEASSWLKRGSSYLYISLLLLLGFSLWFTKLHDLDFWWHIKTGQYILEQRSLPESDPFTFTFLEHDRDMPERPGVILRSYWISQIVLYLVYHYAGPLGIILFRSSIFALILAILWKYLLSNSASTILSVIMLTGFVFFSREYMAERPQIFSFLFSAVVFYLLENSRTVGREQCVTFGEKLCGPSVLHVLRTARLPLVMLLWANMHGGYLVGMAFILTYVGALLFDARPIRSKGRIFLVYFVSLVIAFVNPVTYHNITSFASFQGSLLERETLEFAPLLKAISYRDADWYPLIGLAILAIIIIMADGLRRLISLPGRNFRIRSALSLPAEHFVLLAGTLAASLGSLRYAMFFGIVAVPIITLFLSRRFAVSIPGTLRKGVLTVLMALLLTMSFKSPLFSRSLGPLIEPYVVPVRAVEFIKQNRPEPNLYNDVNWGGYLIWNLYPDYRVFSDTRTLNLEIYRQYLSILNANERTYFGIPEWKALLDMYSIRTIIHSTVNPYSGEIYPLMIKLLGDEAWHLVYLDGTAVVLVRKPLRGLVEYPKGQLLEEVRIEAMRGLKRAPGHPGFLRTLEMLNTLKQTGGR